MIVSKIQSTNIFKSQNNQDKKREFIDIFSDNVMNPRDVQDCVAVPRGIFKAYILLMAGSSLMMIANVLPAKWKTIKTVTNVASALLTGASALYFAKPFAFKGLSPTINRDEFNASNSSNP